MTVATIIIVVSRPTRPNKAAETLEVQVLENDDSLSSVLRRAADQLDAGPTTPPIS